MTKNVLRGLRAVALTGTLVLSSGAAFAENPIKLGVLEPETLVPTAAVAVGLALRKAGDR